MTRKDDTMLDHGRRFAVLWTARGREKYSAVMTLPEAETLAARLRTEGIEGVAIREGDDKPPAGDFEELAEAFKRW
jgi:hypothetical protein